MVKSELLANLMGKAMDQGLEKWQVLSTDDSWCVFIFEGFWS